MLAKQLTQTFGHTHTHTLRTDITGLRDEIANLREPMASRVPLREAIHVRRDAA